MADRITVHPDGEPALVLTAQDHLATGGEGAVYAKGGQVYKVYLDPALARRAGLEAKWQLLAKLSHPGIAAPRAALRDAQGEFIGLALPLVKGEPLCRAFTNAWRDRERFGAAETAQVSDAMRAVMAFAHQHQALMVDANEMNWLLAGTTPVAIDVDSWQLPGFAATAIMPSIRDPIHTTNCEGTDWFAWAVVTFQLWTGIHPYKGMHPDFPPGALQARMQALASVFDPRVRLPGAARPLDNIPLPLRDWYERTFASDQRSAPPLTVASVIARQAVPRLKLRQTLAGALKTERLGHAGGQVVAAADGFVVASTAHGLVLWDAVTRRSLPQAASADLESLLRHQAAVLNTAPGPALLLLDPATGVIRARLLATGESAAWTGHAEGLWQWGRRVFAVVPGVANGLVELDLSRPGAKLVLTIRQAWPVAALSTHLFRGVLVQDCLGAPFLGVLEGDGLLLAPAPQLRGYRIVDGFAAGLQNVWLTGLRGSDGQTVRLELALQAGRYAVLREDLVPTLELDAAANAAGVAVVRDGADLLVSKGQLRKRVANTGLAQTLRLFSLGAAGIAGFDDSEVLRLSLQTTP